MESVISHLLKQFEDGKVTPGLKPRLARGGAIDTPNDVSLTVQDPDGLGVQISGIARPGDSTYPQR